MATHALAPAAPRVRADWFTGHRHLSRSARYLLLGSAITMLVALSVAPQVRELARGLSLVVRAARLNGVAATAAGLPTVAISERLITIPAGTTPLRARVFLPDQSTQTVLLVSGLQPAGIDDTRFIVLARELAKSGVTVVTPDIPELSTFHIGPRLTDSIEQTALWLAMDSGLAPHGRIGLMGVSFSGGLCLVAAGRPALESRLSYVFAFGGFADLPRVLEYSSAHTGASHAYGLAIAMLTVADRLVPPAQEQPLRDGVRQFLQASYRERSDPARAAREIAELRQLARNLPQPGGRLLTELLNGDTARLGAALFPLVKPVASAPALSASRSSAPTAPVFLLHAERDDVIPAAESIALAASLRARGVPVRLLVTPLLSHASADQPVHSADVWKLAEFWGDILSR